MVDVIGTSAGLGLIKDGAAASSGLRAAGTRGEEELAPTAAAKTAHTISILPTLDANMRRP